MLCFIGTVLVYDHESCREYERQCVIAAKTDQGGKKLLADWAANWDGQNLGKPDTCGWLYDIGKACYKVTPYAVQAITPAAFDSVRHYMTTFIEPDCPGQLADETQDEKVKTLARRLGNHLEKTGMKVPHSKLLHAVSASLGESDWHVLRAKAEKMSVPQAANMAIAQDDYDQKTIPGKGFLWSVPVTVDATLTANVLVRAVDEGKAVETARELAMQGAVKFEVDEGNYRGLADYYVADPENTIVKQNDNLGPWPKESAPSHLFAQYGAYLVELTELGGGGDDELYRIALSIFDPKENEPKAVACISSCSVKVPPQKAYNFCTSIASLMARGAPDPSTVDFLTLQHVFTQAAQSEQTGKLWGDLEQKLMSAAKAKQ